MIQQMGYDAVSGPWIGPALHEDDFLAGLREKQA